MLPDFQGEGTLSCGHLCPVRNIKLIAKLSLMLQDRPSCPCSTCTCSGQKQQLSSLRQTSLDMYLRELAAVTKRMSS